MLSLRTYLIVCPLVFLGGFVDSIAGGGGLIALPAYLLAGLPTHYAMGTNKTAMSCGTLASALNYFRAGQIDLKVGILAAAGSFLGGAVGSSFALLITESTLKLILLAILPAVALFLLLKRNFGTGGRAPEERSGARPAVLALLIGLIIGCYDGLIGPGTGTFFILAFTAALGFDLLKSSGCAKVANLSSNVASMIVFLRDGKVLLPLAVPAALFAIGGHWCGAKLAISGGSRYVRYMIFFVIGFLFLKTAFDLL